MLLALRDRAPLVSIAVLLVLLVGVWPSAAAADGPAGTAGSEAVPEAIPFYDLEEQRAIDAINAERRARGLAPVVFSPILSDAAQWMSDDLRTRDLNHTDSLGREIRARLSDFGYPTISAISENIARGFATGADVVAAWMASTGHRNNILDPDVVAYGLARAKRPGGPNEWAWTVNFGSISDGAAAQPPSSRPHEVPLVRGWNLVAWAGDWATDGVLRDTLPPSVTSLTVWDVRADAWFGLLPYLNHSDIAFVGPGQPLWVWSEQGAVWRQPRMTNLGRPIDLIPGWQLVSWQGGDNTPLMQAIVAILPRVQSAARFGAETQAYDLFIPGSPLITFTTLQGGDAFWLLVDGYITWNSGG